MSRAELVESSAEEQEAAVASDISIASGHLVEQVHDDEKVAMS